MIELAARHPGYGWDINKGYSTPTTARPSPQLACANSTAVRGGSLPPSREKSICEQPRSVRRQRRLTHRTSRSSTTADPARPSPPA